ncbi:hypothetical protein, partial [Staphylococcus felis]|uniref:hypothetical protein n=1 Tax=Staphylococcus felis TaxID=46127 RepID=UPI0019D41EAF
MIQIKRIALFKIKNDIVLTKKAPPNEWECDVHPKSWTKKSNFMGCIFMGKHYKFEIKLKIVQEYLNSSLG